MVSWTMHTKDHLESSGISIGVCSQLTELLFNRSSGKNAH